MYYSPLRYPGGKGKLASFMKTIIENTGHKGGMYIEPFAGGAGIALDLLLNNTVSEIVINDYDKGIYSFWKAIGCIPNPASSFHPRRFQSMISVLPSTVGSSWTL